MATKDEKIARLAAASWSIAAIPPWPELPAFLKERYPDKVEEIELYNAQCIEFFKKTGTIAGG